MKKHFTIDREKILSLLEYRDGGLYWKVNKAKRSKYRDLAGCLGTRGYRVIGINGRNYFAHRLIYVMHHGPIPENMLVDHIDRDVSNNRIENLRLATNAQNTYNSAIYNSNTSGCKGVCFVGHDNIWIAYIMVNRKRIHLGRFKTKEQASIAYQQASQKHHGEFAGVNF